MKFKDLKPWQKIYACKLHNMDFKNITVEELQWIEFVFSKETTHRAMCLFNIFFEGIKRLYKAICLNTFRKLRSYRK